MVKSYFLAALPIVAAWPGVMEMNDKMLNGGGLKRRDVEPPPRAPLFLSKRPNTSVPPTGFNAKEQFVNVTQGSGHEWIAPTTTDLRGQCPGLNAAANHNFLPRDGKPTIQQSTSTSIITRTK